MFKLKLGLALRWNLYLLILFAVATAGTVLFMNRSGLRSYFQTVELSFEKAAKDADRAVPSLETLSISKDRSVEYLNELASFTDMQVTVTDLDGNKIYDSMEYMNRYPQGKAKVFISKGDTEPKLKLRTTIRNTLQYFDIGRATGQIGNLKDFSVIYYAPLHSDGDRLIGQLIFSRPMSQLDDVMLNLRAKLILFMLALYAASAALSFVLITVTVTKPLSRIGKIVTRMADMKFSERTDSVNGDEIGELSETLNTMSTEMEKRIRDIEEQNEELVKYSTELETRNQELNRRQRMIEFDLRLAHKIQQELLPQIYPKIKGLQISAANFQVGEIGGDCFDFYKLREDFLGAFIGDVSGKGISAALVMSMVTVLFSQLKDQVTSPSEILGKVNDIMYRHFGSQHSIYLTCFFINIDVDKMELTFSCAGHNPPFLFRAKTGEVIPLEAEGFGLGMFASVTYEEKNIQIENGDKIILYTDGVVDSRNEKGSMFGYERLVQMVTENPDANAFRLTHFLVEELEEFAGGTPRHDDLTLLILEVDHEEKVIEGAQ